MVISEAKTKVANYGQWDHYPSGQGLDALLILRGLDLNDFKTKVDALTEYTEEDLKAIDAESQRVSYEGFKEKYPALHRDTAAQILKLVADGSVTKVQTRDGFVKDSLFCEFAYVVDLDKNTFEVYKGYNKTKLTPEDRFYGNGQPNEGGYYPVKLMHSFSLTALPTNEEFLNILEPKDADEE